MSHEFSMPTKMKWAISLLLFGIAISFVVLPRLIGSVIRDLISVQIFEQIHSSADGRIAIVDSRLETGWFRSKIHLSIEISNTRQFNEPYYLSLHGNISHGPILLTEPAFSFGLASADLVLDAVRFESKSANIVMDLLTTSFLVGFDQSVSLNLMVPVIDILNIDSKLASVINELNVQLEIQEDLSVLAYIKADKVSFHNNLSDIKLNLIAPSVSATTNIFGQTQTASRISAKLPLVDASDPLAFNASDIDFEWRSDPSSLGPSLTDFSQDIQISKIESELPLESILWKSEIKGIKQELITSYNKMLQGIQYAAVTDPILKISELTKIGNETGLLLAQNEIKLKNILEIGSYQGIHKLEFRILWKGLTSIQSIDDFKFEDGLNALNVEIDLLLDQESVSISPFAELAELYISQGYLIPSSPDENLILKAEFREGKAFINNENFPLQGILQ